MILYFADRHLNILGQASTSLPYSVVVADDLKTEDVETGVAIFECDVYFDRDTRDKVEAWTANGNYILRSHGNENEFYTILDTEIDTKKQKVYIYAEDDGLDLINEVVGAFEAAEYQPVSYYVNKYASGAGWEIGINEVEGLTRKLSWDSEETASARLLKIAEAFNGCELSYSFKINGLQVTKKLINIYEKRGKDTGVQLRLNKEIDRIITTKSISNLATALQCTGGTPDGADDAITLLGYEYDDGDFYVDGSVLKSRKALTKWSRYLWKDDDTQQAGGHIVKQFSYDTTSQEVLCQKALAELKTICDIEANYEIENKAPLENVSIGDRVNVIDDNGELYLSTRVLILATSVANQTQTATLGEHLIRKSGIAQKVMDLAAQFASTRVFMSGAVNGANNAAAAAQAQANAALSDAQNAQALANEAKAAADTATQSANAAQAAADTATQSANDAKTKADAAQGAVDVVEQSVSDLQTTVDNAQTAADNAQAAAITATEKAEEAKTAAENAAADAATAKSKAETAQSDAANAIAKSETAQNTASDAKTAAESASATAAAAKADAEQAEKDVAALGEELETVTTTMQTDYARKTELTETTANLQSQITQNSGLISSTVTMLTTIDETANDAQTQAEKAQKRAEAAQVEADKATADAQAAQNAADKAAQAAAAAQAEADTARAAADTAQSILDNAKAELAAAQADLETVMGRADATEAEIAQAQAAVDSAQRAADAAQADADSAMQAAAEAKTIADTAANTADAAQAAANTAASYAKVAQSVASEATNAAAAQTTADDAAETAAEAQRAADIAKTNATNAQATADAAAQAAANAQSAADDAEARAEQAATDLATAQQNLANVTARVDATAEEVAAAQAAVETAQAAANKAKQDAATAQSTADTAKANAATAQTAANNAKTAADNAQAAAADAQTAADKAQADVNALAVTVTAQGTAINQKADKIELEAYKTEVTNTLGGYYTKTQTDAAIKVSADNITSTVSKTIDEIAVGARNLLPNTDFDGVSQRYEMLEGNTTEGGFHFYPTKQIESGPEYTITANIRGNANIVFYEINEGGNVSHWWIKREELDAAEYRRFSLTFSVGANRTFQNAYICTQWGDSNTVVGDWFEIEPGSLKLEKGNKPTDWTPAPEDVSNDISAAQTTADNAHTSIAATETIIQQLDDSISTLVAGLESTTLMTQTENGWTFSTAATQAAVNDIQNGLDTLESEVGGIGNAVSVLQGEVSNLGLIAEYVRITTYTYTDDSGVEKTEPCIELGETDSNFKLRITNTRIEFFDGSDIPAYVNNKALNIEKAVVKNELQLGDDEDTTIAGVWVWKRRSNGNLGLSWKGVDS